MMIIVITRPPVVVFEIKNVSETVLDKYSCVQINGIIIIYDQRRRGNVNE